RIRLLRRCSWRRRSIGAAQPRPFDEPPRLLICPQQGVPVLGSVLEATLLELERRPIELVDQLGVPLPQPFLGQELGRQALEPRDEPAVIGIHAAPPLPTRAHRARSLRARHCASSPSPPPRPTRCGGGPPPGPLPLPPHRRDRARRQGMAAIRPVPPARANGSQPLRTRPLPMDRMLPPRTAWPRWPVGGSTLPVHP